MTRIFYFALASLCVLNLLGCKPNHDAGVDVANATLVTFDQFREATKDEKVFYYLGSDEEFQYFRTKKGFHRMTTSSEILHESRIRRSKLRFENGVTIGEISEVVMIRSEKIGVPAKGVDRNLSYPPLD